MSLDIDYSGFDAAVVAVRDLTQKQKAAILRKTAKGLVGSLVKVTPPFPAKGKESGAFSTALSEHKKAGEAAIQRDIRRVFTPINDLKILASPANSTVGLRIRNLVQGNQYALKKRDRMSMFLKSGFVSARKNKRGRFGDRMAALQAIFKNMHLPPIIWNASLSYHNRMRGRRGRVPANLPWQSKRTVFNAQSLLELKNKKILSVGKSKAGWAKAISSLGYKNREVWQKWISRHTSTPGYIDDQSEKAGQYIEVGDLVPWRGDFDIPAMKQIAGAIAFKDMQAQVKYLVDKMTKTFNSRKPVAAPGRGLRVGRYLPAGGIPVSPKFFNP